MQVSGVTVLLCTAPQPWTFRTCSNTTPSYIPYVHRAPLPQLPRISRESKFVLGDSQLIINTAIVPGSQTYTTKHHEQRFGRRAYPEGGYLHCRQTRETGSKEALLDDGLQVAGFDIRTRRKTSDFLGAARAGTRPASPASSVTSPQPIRHSIWLRGRLILVTTALLMVFFAHYQPQW